MSKSRICYLFAAGLQKSIVFAINWSVLLFTCWGFSCFLAKDGSEKYKKVTLLECPLHLFIPEETFLAGLRESLFFPRIAPHPLAFFRTLKAAFYISSNDLLIFAGFPW